MKLTHVKEVEAAGARIVININPDNQHTIMHLEYTCPDCAGHGCRRGYPNNDPYCSGGTVIMKLDPSKLHQVFGTQASKIIMAFSNLYNEMIDK